MPFIRYYKIVSWGYFGHISEQTHLKPWYKYRVLSKVCMHPKNPDNRNTIPRKLQICCAGYFGHVQAHSRKTENFFEILDKSLSTSKK